MNGTGIWPVPFRILGSRRSTPKPFCGGNDKQFKKKIKLAGNKY